MGCVKSKVRPQPEQRIITKPVWSSEVPITRATLTQMREDFWWKAPGRRGHPVIWNALRQAVEAPDSDTAIGILDQARITLRYSNMSESYDYRGRKYEIPFYALSDPWNLIPEE